jgi:hypothetical protein
MHKSDVAADPVVVLVGPRHHHGRVQRTSLRMRLSGCSSPGTGFLFGRDRIDIGGLDQLGNAGVGIRERLRIFRRTNCARSLPSFLPAGRASQSFLGFIRIGVGLLLGA